MSMTDVRLPHVTPSHAMQSSPNFRPGAHSLSVAVDGKLPRDGQSDLKLYCGMPWSGAQHLLTHVQTTFKHSSNRREQSSNVKSLFYPVARILHIFSLEAAVDVCNRPGGHHISGVTPSGKVDCTSAKVDCE
jgi:hypothetical protein